MQNQLISGDITLTGEVAELLRSRILTGEYKMGEKLIETKIASDLKVSRTPVREALKVLIDEKLVEHIPNKGCFARGFTEKDMEDIYAVRIAVEQLAVEWAINNRDEESLRRLKEQLEIMSIYTTKGMNEKLLQANEDFNNIIYQMTRSRFILQALQSYQDYISLARRGILSNPDNLKGVYEEHARICAAIEEGDVEKAKAEVRAHLAASSKRATERWLE